MFMWDGSWCLCMDVKFIPYHNDYDEDCFEDLHNGIKQGLTTIWMWFFFGISNKKKKSESLLKLISTKWVSNWFTDFVCTFISICSY